MVQLETRCDWNYLTASQQNHLAVFKQA